MKKVLIFGVSGNSGLYTMNYFLKNDWIVYGVSRTKVEMDNTNFTHFQGDITDIKLFDKLPKYVDLVINFAGVQPSILSVSEKTDLSKTLKSYVDINIKGVFNILEYVRINNISTYIYTTTHRDIENHWSNDVLLKNDLPININYSGDHTMYAISKTAAKMMGDYYGAVFGIRVFNLRLPMIFGVPENPMFLVDGNPKLMPYLHIIKQAILGEPLEIWGDPSMKRDYVHIDNLVALITLCYESNLDGGTFNVGTQEGVTTERFVKTIGKIFSPDKELKYLYRPEKRTYKCAVYDISEQRKYLGYEPILLEEMLKRIKRTIDVNNLAKKWGWVD